jgi:phytoene dehydrogenase-like protein
MVHVLDSVDSLAESVTAAAHGSLPRRPTIAVGQPLTVDPTRAPQGSGLLWIQLQENPRHPRHDMAQILEPDGEWTDGLTEAYADRVIEQLSPHITNITSAQTNRVVLGPRELAQMNVNLVGGDPYAGDCRVDQYAAWRPSSLATGHRTGVDDLWHIGASTHPGPGLGGGSGYLVAQRLLAGGRFRRKA